MAATPAPQSPAQKPTRRTPRQAGEAMTDRRSRILAVAAKRFAESGFEATTVRQIADDVNILSGSLYHHFATKDEMLHDIVRAPVEEQADRARRIAAMPLPPEQRLATLIRTDLEAMTRQHEPAAILYAERKFFRRNPDFDYVVKAKKTAYLAWQTILEDGVRTGQFVAGTDIYLTISTTIRMLNTGADWFVHEDGSVLDVMGNYTLERLMDFYLSFILRSLRTPERAGLPIPAV